MKLQRSILAATLLTSLAFAIAPARAADDNQKECDPNPATNLAKKPAADKDSSRLDKDKKQTDIFLRSLYQESGG
jgi:hypothetical protein